MAVPSITSNVTPHPVTITEAVGLDYKAAIPHPEAQLVADGAGAEIATAEENNLEEEQKRALFINTDKVEDSDYDVPFHSAADLFPWPRPEELEKLTTNIQENGLIYPIVVHNGQIVDGRARLEACRRSGVKLRSVEWASVCPVATSLPRWIFSVNGHRRNLTDDQIAAIYVKMCGQEKTEEAKQRQLKGCKLGGQVAGNGRPKESSFPAESSGTCAGAEAVSTKDSDLEPSGSLKPPTKKGSGDARAVMAAEAGVSQHKIQQCCKIQKNAPELLKDIEAGEISLPEAMKQEKANTAATNDSSRIHKKGGQSGLRRSNRVPHLIVKHY